MRQVSLYAMALLYFAAGLNHFIHPRPYIGIMPRWLPWHKELVFISGVCEIIAALLLLPVTTRRFGAWCIIVLLLAVFPANVQMALDYYKRDSPALWMAVLRLPGQLLLIWWAHGFTKTPLL
jgi:uncharacterized membrane protein